MTPDGASVQPPARIGLRRVAKLGFWFFLLKGLAWLALPVVLAWWAGDARGDESVAIVAVQTLPGRAADDGVEKTVRPVKLDAVVVTGTRTPHALSDSPVEVQLITAEEIANTNARDVADVLEREGGIAVSRVPGRGTSIEIQGLSSDQVLILVDGRRVVGRINGAIDLTRLKVASIDHIEIVKGPASALYGSDALGGVINIVSKGAAASRVSIDGRADSGKNFEIAGSKTYALEKAGGTISVGGTLTSPFDLDKRTPATDGITGRSRFFSANHTQNLGERASLVASLDYNLDDTSRVDAGNATFDITKRIEEVRIGASPRLHTASGTDLALDAYYTRYYDQYLQDQRGSDANDRYEKTVDQLTALNTLASHEWAWGESRHRVTGGAEYQHERLSADRLLSDGERDREALYVQSESTLLRDGALTLVPGLRYDRDSQFGSATTPKLAARYNVSTALFFRASAGLGYRAPDFKQLLLRFDNPAVGYRVEGNPDLRPEHSLGLNLGATWLASPYFNLAGTVFHNRVRDLIDIVQRTQGQPSPNNPVIFSYANVERARLTGTDLQAEWHPALPGVNGRPLTTRVGYGYLHSEDADTGQPLSGRARHRVNADLEWQRRRYELGLRGVWVGPRQFNVDLDTGGAPTGAGRAKPYFLFDARAQWKSFSAFDLTFGVHNLFDAGDTRFLPIQPRNVFVALHKDFS